MKTLFSTAALLLLSNVALAKTENWKGTGSVYSIGGDKESSFQITMEVNKLTDTQIKRNYTISIDQTPTVITTSCTQNLIANKWYSECDDGSKEKGFCTNENSCVSYTVTEGSENSFANNFFINNNIIQFIKTELKGSEAIRVYNGSMIKQ